MNNISRREFLRLAGYGVGAVAASSLPGMAHAIARGAAEDFSFAQLSDIHWGFAKKKINPDPRGGLHKALGAINAMRPQPDFVVFTGDLTHTTDDDGARRERMAGLRRELDVLKVRDLRFLPGEHDASLDAGKAYQEFFGQLNYTFDHKGVHFIALDNVSDPRGVLGDAQLRWLAHDLAQLDEDAPLVILAHRPLFELYPAWGWSTGDGHKALKLLTRFEYVSVFYGHIHQQHQHSTGHIQHHSAKSLIFPLPAPGGAPKRKPLPWDPAKPYRGLGLRTVRTRPHGSIELDDQDLEA